MSRILVERLNSRYLDYASKEEVNETKLFLTGQ